ncbi:alpha/beta hydrolase [Mucilaginibacter flavidus]|uniref:alpha/beta hydrolase n=1 Tax=Mucilaginibacter flavidus TaxID=2949309 RepID=UPI00209400AC|nr:alpha/beta hydrolase [Mucilaginibacter flavidus]MCO5950524.1 alpha/beta hydrolase [Mucilaginibacter flavidus]
MNITLYFEAAKLSPDRFEIRVNGNAHPEFPAFANYNGETMRQLVFNDYQDAILSIQVDQKDNQQLTIYLLASDVQAGKSIVRTPFQGSGESVQVSIDTASLMQEISFRQQEISIDFRKERKGRSPFKKPGRGMNTSADFELSEDLVFIDTPGLETIDYDHYDQTPPEKLVSKTNTKRKNTVIDVFYATDRKKDASATDNSYSELRGTIKLGMCKVNIPKRKKMGEVPRPQWYKLEFRESPEKHMMILETKELRPNTFFKNLSGKVHSSPEEDAFVFVHGYNVNFQESILRAAQIAQDINFLGAPIVYSWPSRAATLLYMSDEDNVQMTVSNIVQFLKDVRTSTKAKRIHLIAHSMGNRALTRALIELQYDNFYDGFLFNQVILAAPDIDAQYFIKEIAPKIIHYSGRVTLYTSGKDQALKASRKIHGDILRTGLSAGEIVICDGIDTVDASNVDTDRLGHGYFASTAPLLNDIYQITRNDHSPEERNLRAVSVGEKTYWEFAIS